MTQPHGAVKSFGAVILLHLLHVACHPDMQACLSLNALGLCAAENRAQAAA